MVIKLIRETMSITNFIPEQIPYSQQSTLKEVLKVSSATKR